MIKFQAGSFILRILCIALCLTAVTSAIADNKTNVVTNATTLHVTDVAKFVATSNQSSFEQFKAQQQRGLSKQKKQYRDYMSKADRKFSNYLKQQWKEFDEYKAKSQFKVPKPKKLPVAKKDPKHVKQIITPKKKFKPSQTTAPRSAPPLISPTAPLNRPQPIPSFKPKDQTPSRRALPQPIPANHTRSEVTYFGAHTEFNYHNKIKLPMDNSKIDSDSINQYWEQMASVDTELLRNQLRKTKSTLNLNGWAYLVLLHQLAEKIHPNRINEQRMLVWMLLIKAGYKARIAYQANNNVILLLVPFSEKIYGENYYRFDNLRYYNIDLSASRRLNRRNMGPVSSYTKDYPGKQKLVDINMPSPILLPESYRQKELQFIHENKQYNINVDYNVNTVKLLNTYPQADWHVYYNSDLHQLPKNQLLSQLGSIISGKSEVEAANILLHFVQKSFKYATDDDQFGYEKPLFPHETLFYPQSDCEDRSFLYAWLVRELLGREVVGVLYPGHMATAVLFKTKVKGDKIRYKGKFYTISDPTYIGANIGVEMPNIRKNKNLKIIPISKHFNNRALKKKWR